MSLREGAEKNMKTLIEEKLTEKVTWSVQEWNVNNKPIANIYSASLLRMLKNQYLSKSGYTDRTEYHETMRTIFSKDFQWHWNILSKL